MDVNNGITHGDAELRRDSRYRNDGASGRGECRNGARHKRRIDEGLCLPAVRAREIFRVTIVVQTREGIGTEIVILRVVTPLMIVGLACHREGPPARGLPLNPISDKVVHGTAIVAVRGPPTIECISHVDGHCISDRCGRGMVLPCLNPEFVRETGAEVGALGELQRPVVSALIGGSLGQSKPAHTPVCGPVIGVIEIGVYRMDIIQRDVGTKPEGSLPRNPGNSLIHRTINADSANRVAFLLAFAILQVDDCCNLAGHKRSPKLPVEITRLRCRLAASQGCGRVQRFIGEIESHISGPETCTGPRHDFDARSRVVAFRAEGAVDDPDFGNLHAVGKK